MNQNISRFNVMDEIAELDHALYCTIEQVKNERFYFDEDESFITNLAKEVKCLKNQIEHYEKLISSVNHLRQTINEKFVDYDTDYCIKK